MDFFTRFRLAGYPGSPLDSYQSNHQLLGWVLPPLVICAVEAHTITPFFCLIEDYDKQTALAVPRYVAAIRHDFGVRLEELPSGARESGPEDVEHDEEGEFHQPVVLSSVIVSAGSTETISRCRTSPRFGDAGRNFYTCGGVQQEMKTRWSLNLCVGVGLILAPLAWFVAQIWRAETGNLVPLSTTIDLRQGHVRTAPFRIHIDSAYEIFASAAVKDGGPRSIALEWSVSRSGHELVRRRRKDVYGGGNWVGRFTASPGVYVLNLEVAGDASHFLAGDSQLEVYEAGDIRSAKNDRVIQAFMVLLLLCPIATTVIVLEVRAQRRARERLLAKANSLTQPGPHIRDLPQGAPSVASLVPEELAAPPDRKAGLILLTATIAIFTFVYLGTRHGTSDGEAPEFLMAGLCWLGVSTVGAGIFLLTKGSARRLWPAPAVVVPGDASAPRHAHLPWKRKPAKGRLIAGLTPFPLVMQIFLMVPLFALMLDHANKLTPIGLTVHLLRPGLAAAMSPGIQPLLVQVAAGPQRHGVRVDSKLVVWDDLPTLLRTELMRRPPEWPVYVEGDPAMDWQYVVQVIDVIEGVGGRVVLLTTRPGSEPAERR